MFQKSIPKKDDYDWYNLDNNILGVREKNAGGFGIKVKQVGSIESFISLIKKIIDYYKFQYLSFDSRGIPIEYLKELKKLNFESFQANNYVFQETPNIGDMVIIAIKPYEGKYARGKIKAILTNVKYHPRGVKVVLSDRNATVGRIATIIKKEHLKM
jgi:uncharacterized repeat protein (TIGR03833 family)